MQKLPCTCVNYHLISFSTCPGTHIIDVDAGYWRRSNHSDIIVYCFNQPPACLGGPGTNATEFCYEGMFGALCEECDLGAQFWNESYSNAGPFVCDKCSAVTNNILKIVFVNIFTLVNMFLAVNTNIK